MCNTGTFSLRVSGLLITEKMEEKMYLLFWPAGFDRQRVINMEHEEPNIFSSAMISPFTPDIAVIVMEKALFLLYLSTYSKHRN